MKKRVRRTVGSPQEYKETTPYRSYYIPSNLLKRLPDIKFDPEKPTRYHANPANQQKYNEYGIVYFDNFNQFLQGMYGINQGSTLLIEPEELFGYGNSEEWYKKKTMEEFEDKKDFMQMRYTRFWYEYLKRDRAITSGEYDKARADIYRENITSAINEAKGYRISEKSKNQLKQMGRFINSLSNDELIKLANARAGENDKGRLFVFDDYYDIKGVRNEYEEELQMNKIWGNIRKAIPTAYNEYFDIPAQEAYFDVEDNIKARSQKEKYFKKEYNVKLSEIEKQTKSIKSSYIKTTKDGRRYVLFKKRNVSKAIIDYLDDME